VKVTKKLDLTAKKEFNHGRRNYSDRYRHSFAGCDFLELLAVGKPAHSRSEDVAFDCCHFCYGKYPVAAFSQIERITPLQKKLGDLHGGTPTTRYSSTPML
jgi:hypothetical protein